MNSLAKRRFLQLCLVGVAWLAFSPPAVADQAEVPNGGPPGFVADMYAEGSPEIRAKELEVSQLMAQLDKAREALPLPGVQDLYFTPERKTVTILVTEESSKLRSAVASLRKAAYAGFEVEVKISRYTRAGWDALAEDLLDNSSGWADGLPGRPGGGYMVKEGYVVLTVMDYDQPEQWRSAAQRRAGDRVRVETARVPEGETAEESRTADSAPRSGGARLVSDNGSGCTAGFNWVQWGTGVRWGSTAY